MSSVCLFLVFLVVLCWITDAAIATLYYQPSDEYVAVYRAGGVLVVLGYTTEMFHHVLWSFFFPDREVGPATTKEDDDKGSYTFGERLVGFPLPVGTYCVVLFLKIYPVLK